MGSGLTRKVGTNKISLKSDLGRKIKSEPFLAGGSSPKNSEIRLRSFKDDFLRLFKKAIHQRVNGNGCENRENENCQKYVISVMKSENDPILNFYLCDFLNGRYYHCGREYKDVFDDFRTFISSCNNTYFEKIAQKEKIRIYIRSLVKVFNFNLCIVDENDHSQTASIILDFDSKKIEYLEMGFSIKFYLKKCHLPNRITYRIMNDFYDSYENEKKKEILDLSSLKKEKEKEKRIKELELEIQRLKKRSPHHEENVEGKGEDEEEQKPLLRPKSLSNLKIPETGQSQSTMNLLRYFDSFEIPAKKCLDILGRWEKEKKFEVERDKIRFIIKIIETNSLFKVNLENLMINDKETKNWITNQFTEDKRRKRISSLKAAAKAITFAKSLYYGSKTKLNQIKEEKFPQKVDKILEKVNDLSFNVFSMYRLRDELEYKSLYYVSLRIFNNYRLFQKFQIPMDKFKKVILEIIKLYRDNPYHNQYHATDCLQTVNYFLKNGNFFKSAFSDLDILSLLFATISHDVHHGGFNQRFEIETKSELSLLYNDRSVLENHHCSVVFKLIKKSQYSIFENLKPQQRKYLRTSVIKTVLNTDSSKHFRVISKIKANYLVKKKLNDVSILMSLLMKCSDISNPVKEWKIYFKWTKRVMKEFFEQGKREKELGYKVSLFMDEKITSIPKVQSSFIQYLVKPLYALLYMYENHFLYLLDRLEMHLQFWNLLKKKEEESGKLISLNELDTMCEDYKEEIEKIEKEYEDVNKCK